ncbi:hypothetical protein [Pseudomonas endophytica]|uniref:hypothetical protein n=1 Tax=Pseudomonas endophytica TaxID=1563157 RepID=UPI0012E1B284|nr:hypothetical protein [Pseudomonas endophytica]
MSVSYRFSPGAGFGLMPAAIGLAVAVADPIQQGRAAYQKDQRADLDRSHVVYSWCALVVAALG